MLPLNTHRSGFTLLELMIVVLLFALIGLGSNAMLHAIIKAEDAEKRHATELMQVQKAFRLIDQDLTQMEPFGSLQQDADYVIKFPRRGWSNPLGHARNDRLFVAYAVRDQTLMRYIWPDGEAAGAPAQAQRLVDHVRDLTIYEATADTISVSMTTPYLGTVKRTIGHVTP